MIVFALRSAIALSLWLAIKARSHPVSLTTLAILIILLPLFYNLKVVVTQDDIHCSFGIGLISKTIPIDQIEAVYPVKNPWYFGWGIEEFLTDGCSMCLG